MEQWLGVGREKVQAGFCDYSIHNKMSSGQTEQRTAVGGSHVPSRVPLTAAIYCPAGVMGLGRR